MAKIIDAIPMTFKHKEIKDLKDPEKKQSEKTNILLGKILSELKNIS